MRWNRFFEDLDHQLDSEQAAERLALDGEAERLRLSRLDLRTRLVSLVGCELSAELAGADRSGVAPLRGEVATVGADWVGMLLARDRAAVAPLQSIRMLRLDRAALIASRGVPVGSAGAERGAVGAAVGVAPREPGGRLRSRQTFGFLLRDLARRRLPASVHQGADRVVHGTIDRVAADHLEFALHERGVPRRAAEVSGFRLLPLHAIAWVELEHPDIFAG